VDTAQTEYNREVQLLAKKATTQADVDRAARRLQATTASLDQANEALRIGKNGARKEDLDAKNAEIESLQASVDAAKHQLDDTYLYAPFDGDVAAVYVENFQNVQPKEAIVRLLDTAQIEMTVDVPETLMYDVPQVKNAVVRFAPLGEREFAARIKEIGTEASRATGTFPVTLIIDQPEDVRILPGMTGEAQARDEGSDRKPTNLVVPLAATFADPGAPKDKAYVWVFDRASKTVSRKAVTLGQPTAQGIQIEGLQAGDWVVTAGVHHLEEGQKVEMMQ
jgi:RND family efflux transporter MFP subunit